MPNATLNTDEYITQSSIRSLVDNNIELLSHSDLLRGNLSLGSIISNKGYPAVPSKQDKYPSDGQPYFSGGYNTVRHGSIDEDRIDGIQIENNQDIRFDVTTREAYAIDLTTALNEFIDLHYDSDYLPGYYDPVTHLYSAGSNNIEIYPNPVEKQLKITSNTSPIDVSIFSSQGKKVAGYIWSGNALDVSFLKKGYYYIKLSRKDGSILETKVLVKN